MVQQSSLTSASNLRIKNPRIRRRRDVKGVISLGYKVRGTLDVGKSRKSGDSQPVDRI